MRSSLLHEVRGVIRKKHLSIRTEQAYLRWIVRCIRFSGTMHPKNLSEDHVSRFLSYLATDLKVLSSAQNQAPNALVFLFKHILRIDLGEFGSFERAKRPVKLPVVMTKAEWGSRVPWILRRDFGCLRQSEK